MYQHCDEYVQPVWKVLLIADEDSVACWFELNLCNGNSTSGCVPGQQLSGAKIDKETCNFW